MACKDVAEEGNRGEGNAEAQNRAFPCSVKIFQSIKKNGMLIKN